MDIAIVTGASSSLGLAISRRLIQLGFRVYGLGGDYTDCPLQNVNFRPVSCNLADPAAVEAAANRIIEKEKGVLVLVNNAKYFGQQSYLDMSPAEMQRVLNINLLCPLVLTRTFAQGLIDLQGYVIQLGPLHVESNRGGPTGAATAGGLKWMSELLFQDLRQYGVKVCHLSPEPNRGRDPRTTVRQGSQVTSSIDPEAVAQAVEQLLQSPFGNIITEMVMRPLRVSEPDQNPVVKLPYPKPKPIPYTVPRELIEAEEQLEEEDYRKAQQERQKRRKEGAAKKATKKVARKRGRKPAQEEDAEKPEQQEQPADKQDSKPDNSDKNQDDRPERTRRRRKRPDRNRNDSDKQEAVAPKPAAEKSAPQKQEEVQPEKSRRRRRRKPRPPKVEVGFHAEPAVAEKKPEPAKAEKKPDSRKNKDQDRAAPTATKKSARKRVPKKVPARKKAETAEKPIEKPEAVEAKATKKAARKTPAKKATKKATKKAVKKTTRKKVAARKKTTKNSEGDAGGKSD